MTVTARPIENCYWVVPGKVLAGEYPRDLNNAVSKLARLTGAGVTTFIDLTVDRELKPYAHLLEGQASHQRFPIRDMSTPRSPERTSAALDAIDEHIRNGEGVAYVHCWGGTGRTGTIIGCWLARHGRTGEAALARLAELWKTNPKSSRRPVSPERESQRDYVRNWREVNRTIERPIENCYWVVPGKVLAGEYPRDPDNAFSKLARLTEAGVTAFIDLTVVGEASRVEGERKPYAHLLERQASHQRFPIHKVTTPGTTGLTATALDAIDAHISSGKGVIYVHCGGGTGRTGTIIGCWLGRHGHTGPAALRRLAELYQTNPKSQRRPLSPDTNEQRAYIRRWQEQTR